VSAKRKTIDVSAWLKSRINVARAETGMSWAQVAEGFRKRGHAASPSSLMSKHSRGSFTAVELVTLLMVLGVEALELPKD
jgi:hypothetical protein